jgi:hypothetical protein
VAKEKTLVTVLVIVASSVVEEAIRIIANLWTRKNDISNEDK